MDRVGLRRARRGDQRIDPEVALARRRRSDADRAVGEPHRKRIAIGLGVSLDRLDVELVTGANDPKRDFAAVRDEDAAKATC